MAKRKIKTITPESIQHQILKEMDALTVGHVKQKVIPLRRKCGCGRRVIGHHKYCKKCWEKHRARIKNKKDTIEIIQNENTKESN
jgi:hypothetical protein